MRNAEERRKIIASAFDEALDEDGFAPEGYEILEELDRGGMAVVYKARQLEPLREVALKVVLPKFAAEEAIRERFQREGRAMAALEHPAVLPVYQVGEFDGMPFLAMKLARGGSLLSVLKDNSRLKPGDAVEWLAVAGEAVHFAHQRGVLHRDLKPGNLLFDSHSSIYVGDFGVAKLEFARDGELTKTESFVGTPHYLAPEVASGVVGSGSVATDQYALGAVLYECLTGVRPHDGAENMAAHLRAIVDDAIVPVRKLCPEVPRDLAVICEKAVAKRPDDRYRTVADFVEDLRRWKDGREILARPAGLAEKAWRWARRHPLPASLAALLLCTSIIGTALLLNSYQHQADLLHESLIERAKAERLVGAPGFRERALNLLKEADAISDSDQIRKEAVATFAQWDVGPDGEDWRREPTAVHFTIEAKEGGVQVLPVGPGGESWFIAGGVLRCAPVFSGDGRFLAMVRGDQMEVTVFDVLRQKRFVTIPLEGWPEKLEFVYRGELLKMSFPDGVSSLASVRGNILLAGFNVGDPVKQPIGFTVWSGQSLAPLEANAYGGKLSGSGRFLATTSAVGLHIWDVANRSVVDFYEVENQRIDAKTDAWWLDAHRLLIQVPGAREILKIGEDGKVIEIEELARVPGTRVMSILRNGDWVVDVKDEDGSSVQERWAGGDFQNASVWVEIDPEKRFSIESDTVVYQDWTLTLPQGGEIVEVFLLDQSERVIALTKDYRVCDWDLNVLQEALEKLGFW